MVKNKKQMRELGGELSGADAQLSNSPANAPQETGGQRSRPLHMDPRRTIFTATMTSIGLTTPYSSESKRQ